MPGSSRVCTVAFAAIALCGSSAEAQDNQPDSGQGQALAKQLANPIASLISVPLQNNVDWGLGPRGDGTTYRLNIQPVIPITLGSDWNMISRTIVPVVDQNDLFEAPHDHQFGLGDTVQSLFFSPQKPTSGGLIWGAGPVLLLRTATDRRLGGGKWGVGPTVVVLKQSGPWTYGALLNHIWSVAGAQDRNRVSASFMQPFLAYTTSRATTFTVNSETTYDWANRQWTVPLNLMVSQLFKPGRFGQPFPVQLQVGYRHYVASPPGGPNNGIRFSVVALFPRKK